MTTRASLNGTEAAEMEFEGAQYSQPEMAGEGEAEGYSYPEGYSNPYSAQEMEDEWEMHEGSSYSNPYSNPEMEWEMHEGHPYSNPEMEWEMHEGHPYSNPEMEWEMHEANHYNNPYSNPETEWEMHESHPYSNPEMEWEMHEANHYNNPYSNPEMEWEMHEGHPYSNPEMEWEMHEANHYNNPYSNPEMEWEVHEGNHYNNPYSNPEMEWEMHEGHPYSNPEIHETDRFVPVIARIATRLLPKAARIGRNLIRGMRQRPSRSASRPYPASGRSRQHISSLFQQLARAFAQGESEAEAVEAHLFGSNEFEMEVTAHEMARQAALSEVLAAEAAHTESESEAQAMLGAALPISMRVMGGGINIRRLTPTLLRVNARLTLGLHRQGKDGRQLMRVIPKVQRNAISTLKAIERSGKPVTPAVAAQVMTGQAARVLTQPHVCRRALTRNMLIRQQTVNPARSGTRPGGRWVYQPGMRGPGGPGTRPPLRRRPMQPGMRPAMRSSGRPGMRPPVRAGGMRPAMRRPASPGMRSPMPGRLASHPRSATPARPASHPRPNAAGHRPPAAQARRRMGS